MMLMQIFIILQLFASVFCISRNVTVGTLGTVIGLQEYSAWSNRTLYTFRGIPYAEPPIEKSKEICEERSFVSAVESKKGSDWTGLTKNFPRVQPPVSVTSWNETTLYATKYGNICPQGAAFAGNSTISEDCLTLNVHVPEVANENTVLPVMIWIHGGTFMSGSATMYEPHFLLEKDVILVVPQFRIGPLGLLCLQTDEIPGNVQFLDQIMAMKWVRDNIVYFGGNPDQVTLIGQSSGAASVNLHQFSPLSKGLFHRAIIQSGSAFAPWTMDYNPVQTATRLGVLVGCGQTNITELAACYKRLNYQTIVDGFDIYLVMYTLGGLTEIGGHRAVIQTAGTQRFLVEDPMTLLEKAEYHQVPIIGGATKHDGSFPLAEYYQSYFLPFGLIDDTDYLTYNLTNFVTNSLGMTDQSGGISQTLMNTYYKKDQIGDFFKMIPGLIDICSVFAFKAGVLKMLQANSRTSTSYLYTFGYFGTNTGGLYATNGLPFELGISHSDELYYLFPLIENLSSHDVIVAKRLVSLWTSFAITGQPKVDDVTWEPMNTAFGPYLIIDEEFFDGTDYLSEYTIALKEGLTAVDRSMAINVAPQSVLVLIITFSWSIFKL